MPIVTENMPKKPKISENDRQLFQDAVKGVTPLVQDKHRLKSPVQPGKSSHDAASSTDTPPSLTLSDHITETVDGNTQLIFKRPGVQPKQWRQLQQGRILPAATLDLHGETVASARKALERFLADARQAKKRCLRIIHGRGNPQQPPVLKNHLNAWLPQIPFILAFCSCPPADGGRGALYVLLQRIDNST